MTSTRPRSAMRWLGILVLCVTAIVPLHGQPKTKSKKPATTPASSPAPVPVPPHQAQVVVDHQTLFPVQGVLSFSAEARADAIFQRVKQLSKQVMFNPEQLSVADTGASSDIMANDLIVMSVTDQDAQAAGTTREDLAASYAQKIRSALIALRKEYSLKSLLFGLLYAAIATAVLILIFRILRSLFPRLYRTLESWSGTRIRSLRIQRFELLPAARITDFCIGVAKLVRFGLVLIALYFYASLVLGLFPWTRGYAQVLVGYVLSPLRLVSDALVSYLPNVFFIAVISVIVFYVTKFIKIIFTELGRSTITMPGFYPEWAQPTYKIVRFLVITLPSL